jgi:NTE family protein
MTFTTVMTHVSRLAQDPAARRERAALVLMGGGARTAYQAGVLRGIAQILDAQAKPLQHNPFKIIVGTSAGSINAAFYACRCLRWRQAIDEMEALWKSLHTGDVYRADLPNVAATGMRWLSLLALGWVVRKRPKFLLDNTPLAATLNRKMDFPQLDAALQAGAIEAIGITASSYTSGEHLTYVQSQGEVHGWQRPGRRAVMQPITVDHLLASSAIPFVFPATPLWRDDTQRVEFFGDGSMRQLSPLSPAIHLGATRILAIGVGRAEDATPATPASGTPAAKAQPSLAQIAGHSMATVFYDTLRSDVEQTQRLNEALLGLPATVSERLPYRPIDVLMFLPSRSLEALAMEHVQHMPRPVHGLLRSLGATEQAGAGLASYLLFEPPFCQALIELGIRDAFAQKAAVLQFFSAL